MRKFDFHPPNVLTVCVELQGLVTCCPSLSSLPLSRSPPPRLVEGPPRQPCLADVLSLVKPVGFAGTTPHTLHHTPYDVQVRPPSAERAHSTSLIRNQPSPGTAPRARNLLSLSRRSRLSTTPLQGLVTWCLPEVQGYLAHTKATLPRNLQ